MVNELNDEFSNDFLELLTCAKPCSFVHVVKTPISISCGHSICKKCIPLNDRHEFKCRICNKNNSSTLVNWGENLTAKFLLKNSQILVSKFIKNCANHLLDLYQSKLSVPFGFLGYFNTF
jgi:hypothetical protein